MEVTADNGKKTIAINPHDYRLMAEDCGFFIALSPSDVHSIKHWKPQEGGNTIFYIRFHPSILTVGYIFRGSAFCSHQEIE